MRGALSMTSLTTPIDTSLRQVYSAYAWSVTNCRERWLVRRASTPVAVRWFCACLITSNPNKLTRVMWFHCYWKAISVRCFLTEQIQHRCYATLCLFTLSLKRLTGACFENIVSSQHSLTKPTHLCWLNWHHCHKIKRSDRSRSPNTFIKFLSSSQKYSIVEIEKLFASSPIDMPDEWRNSCSFQDRNRQSQTLPIEKSSRL